MPRAEPLAVDRATLRRCMASVGEDGGELLDELGRLDEQLRAR
ncbi:hypothetical protein [Streptomyces sp. MK7]|nr:hypothetical protein [Streptomyces sp. MK7]